MKATLAFTAALAALTAAPLARGQAADPPLPPPMGPEGVQPGVYVIDTKETNVRYGTIHMGLTEFWGTFPGATGTLTIDPKNIAAAKLEVSVPVVTITTGNRTLDGELVSDEFLGAGKFRSMKFVSTSVTRTGERTARMAGDLTIHGVTKPVVFNVTFNGAGPNAFSKVLTLGFKAEGKVKRSDFGVGKYVPIVSDETTINISAAFEKKKDG